MASPSSSADSSGSNSRRAPRTDLSLSEEEKKVLKECQDESFYRRSLPMSCGAFVGVQLLTRAGKLAPHPKYGALPKSMVAVALAFIGGKLSYAQACQEKILEKIPDSNLAMTIKKNRDRRLHRGQFSDQPANEENEESSSSVKLPADRPSFAGLSDNLRPSLDNEVKFKPEEDNKSVVSYDDLRKRNRQEYDDKKAAPQSPGDPSYKQNAGPFAPDERSPAAPLREPFASASPQAPPKKKRTNMWGDVIEE